jgi:hypothetical protein
MCQTNYKNERYTKNGKAMHTCNGDIISGLPFGKKAPVGQCRRCDELHNGSLPRTSTHSINAQQDAQRLTAIKNHDFAACAAKNGCCTCFEW